MHNVKNVIKEMGIKKLGLILLLGVLLLIITLPTKEDTTKGNIDNIHLGNDNKKSDVNYVNEQEKKLEKVLRTVEGIDKVKVMLTIKSSTEEVILKDSPYSKEENGEDNTYANEEETVIIEDNDGNSYPYVVKEINPEIEGIVVAVKTNDENVEREIIDVVLALFDIPVHKIKVMKMK